jgi:hypothetical protein
MPITVKPPPQFSKLIPFVSVVNEFEDMPPTYVPMARLVSHRTLPRYFLSQFRRRLLAQLLQVMATLISKAQDLMKGQPQDAACTAFINHLIDAFTAMKSKITKDVSAKNCRKPTSFFFAPPPPPTPPHFICCQAAEASRPVLAKVASKCFKVADDQDRAGEATRETAKDFNKARCM